MKRLHAVMLVSAGMLIGFVSGAALTTAYSEQRQFDYNQVVGQFGETKITRSRLAEHAIAQVGPRLLRDTLADIAVVEEEARKRGVTVAADEIKQRIDETFKFAESEKARKQLEAVPQWLLQERIRTMLLVEKMTGTTVSKNEVDTFYTEHPNLFFRPAMADLLCIATPKKNDAQVAFNRLKDGENPAMLSQKFSSDASLKEAKGDIGWATRAMLMPDAAEAVFDANNGNGLKCGEFTPVLTTKEKGQTMYVIFVVKEMRPNYAPRLEDVRPAVTFLARTAKFEDQAPKWFKENAAKGQWKQIRDINDPASDLVAVPISADRYGK